MQTYPQPARDEPAQIHVLYENPEWLPPIAAAFDSAGIPWSPWLMTEGSLDLATTPPDGIFWSRMSASAHTRGHADAVHRARAVLSWLESHGRRVINGSRVLDLELSKADQLSQLAAAGFDVPRTLMVSGDDDLLAAAKELPTPFVVKPNRGGKGLGVARFDSHEDFSGWAEDTQRERPVDGITLIQEYVEPRQPRITRVELVAGRYLYALTADTARGGFQLCPAEACAVDGTDTSSLFEVRRDFDDHPIIKEYEQFSAKLGIEIAGFEFIESIDGRLVTYDINTNTNYNPEVDAAAPRSGPAKIAAWMKQLLDEVTN